MSTRRVEDVVNAALAYLTGMAGGPRFDCMCAIGGKSYTVSRRTSRVRTCGARCLSELERGGPGLVLESVASTRPMKADEHGRAT
jgi:hypothetical protein